MIETIGCLFSGTTLWSVLIFLVILGLTRDLMKRRGLPPGPYGLPFLGYVFLFDRTKISEEVNDLCRKYKTDILAVSSIGPPLIILNSYDMIKEVFQKRADMADREEVTLFTVLRPNYSGIIATSGHVWKEARRFSVSALRDFGMGKVGAEERVQNESKILNDILKTYAGKPMDPSEHINVAVSNIICGMVFGQRFEHDDPEFIEALDGMNSMTRKMNSVALFVCMRYKFLRDYPLRKKLNELAFHCNKMSRFVQRRIKEHREVYDGEVTDMIHAYLKEVEQGHHPDIFDDTMLESLIIDYFFAGSETTYTTLGWCLLAMAAYPDVQQKVQEELDEVIGDRPVSMSDKKQTPYTEAVLSEVQRYFTLFPFTLPHSNLTQDISINGYRIPKSAFVLGNLKQMHRDEKVWKNPQEFDPENFLDDGKIANLDRMMAFSIGRRSCAGEALARMELYLFYSSLVKEFEIRLETDDTEPDLTPVVAGVVQPTPFKVRMIPRC